MATWELELYDLAGSLVLNEAPSKGTSFSRVLTASGGIEIDLPWSSAAADWVAGSREIRVLRNGSRAWGGFLWSVRADARTRKIKVQGAGYFSRLYQRVVTSDLDYSAGVAAQQIAWNLINHTQGQTDGALGFTQGTHMGASTTRRRTYCARERPNIAESILDLAALENGFDFEVDPTDKSFDTWTPKRGSASGITLTGTEEMTLEWDEDAREAASYVSAIGLGECSPVGADVSDATAITRFGRLHAVVEAETDLPGEATEAANEELRIRKSGLFRAKVAFDDDYGPAWGSYNPGDTLTLAPADGFATWSKTLRITEIGVTLEYPDVATVELTLDAAL